MDARVGNAEVGGQETGDDSLPPSISFVLWEWECHKCPENIGEILSH